MAETYPSTPAISIPDHSWSFGELVAISALSGLAGILARDWIAGAAAAVLWLVWKYMRDDEGLPVLAIALTFQWLQVTIGIWYFVATGRRLDAMELSDYRPMVLAGLGCVLSLACGLFIGLRIMGRWRGKPLAPGVELAVRWPSLIAVYAGSFAAQGALQGLAFDYPDLTQPILALKFVHLAALFVILRRLARWPVRRWWITGILGLEVVVGLTGYFAGFRDPLVMGAIAISEVFNRRRLQHWLILSVFAVLMFGLAIMWMSVRPEYRALIDDDVFNQAYRSKVDTIGELSSKWWRQDSARIQEDLELFLNRMWVIYYPALAMARVPSVLPHTNGALLLAVIQHVVSPRVLFPTKAELYSDSEMVRKYAGVFVAGIEQNTSIAFGYGAEMYLDFGVPLMFLPMIGFAMLMGIAYEALRTRLRHDDLRKGLLTVVFWLSLYLFERSFAKTVGLAGTLLVYLGGPALLLDYYLSRGEVLRHAGGDGAEHTAGEVSG